MASAPHDSPSRAAGDTGTASPLDNLSGGVEISARAGYTAKGVVYAMVGGLAIQQAIGGGDIAGSREALAEIFSGPFGTVVLGLVAVGLAGYVIWRIVQAIALPGQDGDDGTAENLGRRAFYLLSAGIYGALTWYAISLLTGNGGGSGDGGGGSGGFAADLMALPWGRWLVGAVGVAIVVRGLLQLRKAYTDSFKERLQTFDLGGATRTWVMRASRFGLTARGVVFGIIGVSLVYAGLNANPEQAKGTEGALQVLVGNAWLLGLVGAGLVGYAVYQWTKARYRLIGV